MRSLPRLDRRSVGTALAVNRQFVAFTLVVLVVVGLFPGSPGRRLIAGLTDSAPTSTSQTVTPPVELPPTTGPGFTTPSSPPPPPAPPTSPAGDPEPEQPPLRLDDLRLPPGSPPPVRTCDTDALFAAVHDLRAGLAALLGHVPGESLERLAQLATGCTEDDPTMVLLEVGLDLAKAVPDLGLPIIPLPELPGIPDLPIPPEVLDLVLSLLGPAGDGIREACGNLGLVSLLFVALPPALHLPFAADNLIQLLTPASTICALFDKPVSR